MAGEKSLDTMPNCSSNPKNPPYGDPTELNTLREVLDSAGKDILTTIIGNFLDLLGTSAAVYEKNGDYALGIFASGWCGMMDSASRNLCGTFDNREALHCGKWLCRDSCWSISKVAIDTGGAADQDCQGGDSYLRSPYSSSRRNNRLHQFRVR